MSFTFTVMTMLLGSAVVSAFILQPAKEENAASDNSPNFSQHSCRAEPLQSIRTSLLNALNLQTEPRLPAGGLGLDAVRDQWQRTFGSVSHRAKQTPAVVSVSPDDGNSTSLKCCSITSEIFMTDLGWDKWVIHPSSVTIVQCSLCNTEDNTVRCPSSHTNVQVPCCQPRSQETVPIVYVDESSSVVISSVDLIRSCGCEPANVQQIINN